MGEPSGGERAKAVGSHLRALSTTPEWAIWRVFVLRGAGMPLRWVRELPGCAGTAEATLRAHDSLQEATEVGVAVVDRALDRLKADGEWDDRERRGRLLRTRRRVAEGKRSAVELLREVDPQAALRLERARDVVARADGEWEAAYAACVATQSAVLSDIASRDLFREAVLWQNPRAHDFALAKIAGKPDAPRNSQRRQHEELVAAYLQRYTTKNDTIGFFGPSAWGQIEGAERALQVRQGDGLIRRREVFLEAWAVRELAEEFERAPGVRRHLAPVRSPHVRLTPGRAHLPGQPPLELAPEFEFVLRHADGARTAASLATEMTSRPDLAPAREEEVFALLEQLVAFTMLTWSFQVPFHPRALQWLRARLAELPASSELEECRRAADRLEEARREVAAASGKPDQLRGALGALDERFSDLVSLPAERRRGQTYAARTICYEDCVRDLEVSVGVPLVEELVEALTPLLQISRWASAEIARRVKEGIHRLFDAEGVERMDAVSLYALLSREEIVDAAVDEAVVEARRRWLECLPELDPSSGHVALDGASLARRVERAFPCDAAGWQMAIHHAPDVMIASSSVEGVRSGDYFFVLGEIHPAIVSIKSWVFLALSPRAEEIARALDEDLSAPQLHFIPPTSDVVRTAYPYVGDSAITVSPPFPSEVRPLSEALPMSDIDVTRDGEELRVVPRDGGWELDICAGLGELLTQAFAHHGLPLFEPAAHRPRFSIDRLVVARRAWSLSAAELSTEIDGTPSERFLRVQQWRRSRGVPRYVFVKSPLEPKPQYIDFSSPVLVDIFVRDLRRASRAEAAPGAHFVLTEMLPGHGETWLADASGERYVSELRLTCVDRCHPGGT